MYKENMIRLLLSRRELIVRTAGVLSLAGLGKGMVSTAIAATSNPVVLTPEDTEGPYWRRILPITRSSRDFRWCSE